MKSPISNSDWRSFAIDNCELSSHEFFMGSSRVLRNFFTSSFRVPYDFLASSFRVPYDFLASSFRVPYDFLASSFRVLHSEVLSVWGFLLFFYCSELSEFLSESQRNFCMHSGEFLYGQLSKFLLEKFCMNSF